MSKYTQDNYVLTEEDKAELINKFKLAFSEAAEQLMTEENYGQDINNGNRDGGDTHNHDSTFSGYAD